MMQTLSWKGRRDECVICKFAKELNRVDGRRAADMQLPCAGLHAVTEQPDICMNFAVHKPQEQVCKAI